MSADSEKPNITGGIWMKYCTVTKSMGRERPICVEVNGCARTAAEPIAIAMGRSLRKRRVFGAVSNCLKAGPLEAI